MKEELAILQNLQSNMASQSNWNADLQIQAEAKSWYITMEGDYSC